MSSGAWYLADELVEAEEEALRREQEWIIDRKVDAFPVHAVVMPWLRHGEEDRRFRKSLAIALALSALFALLAPWIDRLLPEPARRQPERLTRLIIEQPEPPAPAPRLRPPEQKLAEETPKPETPKPEKPKPKEVPAQIARRPEPPPPPKPLPRKVPAARPKLELAAMEPLPEAAPRPEPRRTKLAAPAPEKPRFDLVPAVPSALALKEVDEAAAPRRFAAVRQAPSARPFKADLGPPIAARELSAPRPDGPPVRTRSAPRAHPAAPRRADPIDFAAAVAPGPAAPTLAGSETRRGRPVPQSKPSRGAPRPEIRPALAAAGPAPRAGASQPPARVLERPGRVAGPRERVDRSAGADLRGVPLASLAACVSDREEDALKRKVVAAVTTQTECISPAGTYRFVETKNLNAFLMTIERAPRRAAADRCAELSHALACLER